MKSTNRFTLAALSALAAASTLVACTATGPSSDSYVDGATFTIALGSDPGNLDPQASAATAHFQLTKLAYDALVSIDADGEVGSQLATDWSIDGSTASLTIAENITCADGSAFTAQTAADNLTYLSDPENASPFLGSFLPGGISAEAEGDTLTLTLATPAPFLFLGLANVPMVCDGSVSDRSGLAAGTDGTGPYVLTEAVPDDHYSYTLREGYDWGPDGATTDESGLPAVVVARIVTNETTAANLLLSGELNSAQILGPDVARLEAVQMFSQQSPVVSGEQWHNQAEGHPTSDPAVRMALAQGTDFAELRKVISSGADNPATALTVVAPAGCSFDSVSGNLPTFDVNRAAEILDDAGWTVGADGVRVRDGVRLSLTFLYDATSGVSGSSAAELASKAWQDLGMEVNAQQQDSGSITGAMFSTGDWDIVWAPVNVSNPSQIVGFVSGPAVPAGGNFASITNAKYDAKAGEAMALTGSKGCDLWAEAETALISAADVIPFSNDSRTHFGTGAEFIAQGAIVPTSIRMIG